jgi:hypothetical protein
VWKTKTASDAFFAFVASAEIPKVLLLHGSTSKMLSFFPRKKTICSDTARSPPQYIDMAHHLELSLVNLFSLPFAKKETSFPFPVTSHALYLLTNKFQG